MSELGRVGFRVLAVVTAPHFCASLVVDCDGRVSEAAPILRWCRRKPWPELYDHFRSKGWEVTLQVDPAVCIPADLDTWRRRLLFALEERIWAVWEGEWLPDRAGVIDDRVKRVWMLL